MFHQISEYVKILKNVNNIISKYNKNFTFYDEKGGIVKKENQVKNTFLYKGIYFKINI